MRPYSYLLFSCLLLFFACKGTEVDVVPTGNTNEVPVDTPNVGYTIEDLTYPISETVLSGHRGAKRLDFYPENCVETFQYLRGKYPMVIECDVAGTKDGILVLMHDRSIDRTTTGSGTLTNLNYADIEELKLKDHKGNVTTYGVSTFEETMDWAKTSRSVLSVDLKGDDATEAAIVAALQAKDMVNHAFLISYSLEQAARLHALAPEYMQSVSIRSLEEWDRYKVESIPPTDKVIAFTGTRQSPAELYDTLHAAGITCIFGSLGNIDQQAEAQGPQVYKDLVAKGVDILATDIPLTAGQMLEL